MIGKGLLGSLLVLAVAFGPNQATAMEMMIVCTAAGGIASTEEDDANPEDDKDELEVTVWVPPGEARDTVMSGGPVMVVTLIDLGDSSGESVSRTTKLPDTGVVTEIWSREDLTKMFRAEATKFGVLLTLENQRSVVPSGQSPVDGVGLIAERVALNFTKVVVEYTRQEDDGGSSETNTWELETTECKSESSKSE
jgi:hypothetical protein